MSRILILGHCPPVLMHDLKVEAANHRTWQFMQPLIDDGHQVLLCTTDLADKSRIAERKRELGTRLDIQTIQVGTLGWPRVLQALHDDFEPECIVAVGFRHCLLATKIRSQTPVWMDVYGDELTILQAASYRSGSNRGIPTTIGLFEEVLVRGDAFSVCAEPQRHALVGELAMVGRLNHLTFGYEFVQVVLPGAAHIVPTSNDRRNGRHLLESKGLEDVDFAVLWCGGYNAWMDVETLFRGVDWAMRHDSRVHLVSVGGSTYTAADNVYARFVHMIEDSEFRHRFHMFGWQPWSTVERFYRESDVGINIDGLHYETIYGTRTRLVEMIAAGLPVITSLGSELSYMLSSQSAALSFETGDWRTFGKHITALSRDGRLRHELSVNGIAWAANELSFATTTEPVRSWVQHPLRAPDNVRRKGSEQLRELEYRVRSVARLALWKTLGLDQ